MNPQHGSAGAVAGSMEPFDWEPGRADSEEGLEEREEFGGAGELGGQLCCEDTLLTGTLNWGRFLGVQGGVVPDEEPVAKRGCCRLEEGGRPGDSEVIPILSLLGVRQACADLKCYSPPLSPQSVGEQDDSQWRSWEQAGLCCETAAIRYQGRQGPAGSVPYGGGDAVSISSFWCEEPPQDTGRGEDGSLFPSFQASEKARTGPFSLFDFDD